MSDARAGERDLQVVVARRWPRRLVATLIAVVLLVVFAGSALTSQFFSAFPRGACKGVGYASAISGAGGGEGSPQGYATPVDALAAFAPFAPPLGGQPVPADGWEEYRGHWVRDMHDGTYYEVGVHEGPGGWLAGGDVWTCGF
jgi:hypothetical protein